MKFAPVTLALTAAIALGPILAGAPTVALAQDGPPPPDAQYHSAEDYCHHQKKHGQHVGAILGAIGGAIIGSNLAAHSGGRAGGAVLGGAAGAAIGSNIGRSAAKCTDKGDAFWTEDQTYAWDDSAYYHAGGAHDDDWYRGHNCRWGQDYDGSYARVCRRDDGNYYYTE